MAIGDKENWWEEYHGFMQDLKEDGYKPNVKIEYMDEKDWKHTQGGFLAPVPPFPQEGLKPYEDGSAG
ncbi:U4/U6.U5 tri-snRNP-associated protein 1 [Sciurus carolinensis]|uniref:U4/U6.U5 tri-snRNP-associated protein 1 n=1 Tax=Sciurus carolinensis TaxID=30640 RepID=A0AA41SYJ7_SCICA|nr:U4/U6.U5 tri-snRNP-associated protein 1 [Sciurus carolinensis]